MGRRLENCNTRFRSCSKGKVKCMVLYEKKDWQREGGSGESRGRPRTIAIQINHRPIVTYQADATIDLDSSGGRLPKDWHGPNCSALGGAAAKAEVVHKAMREATWWAKKGVPSFFKRSKNQHN